MAENNKLSASSEYQSDVSTELNVSASLSNNESSGSNVRDSVTSITTANAQSSTPDLKNVQDLTRYVELLLQQMQERFQNISDQVLSRNILFKLRKA
ncbi:hypothetical protein OUZ56_018447 [Daphnia magna]|uniref:Uncharacterized protein n=1 Tax=Daphnia magna TaxID=35525 RepID=A0ABQ9Z8V6_9CRUS|nr:hypothetical protein OUZ56_018447 [Daphnia magna]